MAKKLITMPPGMLEEIDRVAKLEHRTRSELIREALRQYIRKNYPTEGLNNDTRA